MAFYITKNGQPNVILTDGGSIEVGENLSVDENGKLNAQAGTEVYVDDELSLESENPVQNKVITKTIEDVEQVTAAALNDLNDKKADRDELAQVAFTGDYNDLENKPTIPEEFTQQQVDWNATSGVTSIKNKPNLATVATSGNYNDLGNKPNLAAVATSGSYNDLSDKPEVAQSDWNESDSSSPAFIKNKPAKLGGIDNIKVNGVKGDTPTEEDGEIIAPVNITGANIPVTGLTESTATNEGLEINATTDNVNIALGKLQKALKDDEAALVQAFMSIQNAAGFDDNLNYVKAPEGTILGDDPNVQSLKDADEALMNRLQGIYDTLTKYATNKLRLRRPYGSAISENSEIVPQTVDLVNFGVNDVNGGGFPYTHDVNIPRATVLNITLDYPANLTIGQQYWSIEKVYSNDGANILYTGLNVLESGSIITFEKAAKEWVGYQYVGTDTQFSSLTDQNNWIKIWGN